MNIYQSIARIMEEAPAIGKDKKNTQQNFMYRGIDDVMNAFQPLLAKNKVFIVPQVLEQKREERTTSKGSTLLYSICTIKYTFYAEDGSFIEAITIGEGMDSGDKATNKAMAIAMKYALFQVFCIPTEDDPDGSSTELAPDPNNKISEENAKILHDLMVRKGLDPVVQLQANYNVSSTSELTEMQRINILKAIEKMPDKK